MTLKLDWIKLYDISYDSSYWRSDAGYVVPSSSGKYFFAKQTRSEMGYVMVDLKRAMHRLENLYFLKRDLAELRLTCSTNRTTGRPVVQQKMEENDGTQETPRR